jgi:hypothetical protein
LLTNAIYMIGWSLGLVLENVGGDGRSTGRLPPAAEIAVCTSVAAASMLLDSLNCNVMLQVPCVLLDVTRSRPLICMNCFSSGVATFEATVSGEAPG